MVGLVRSVRGLRGELRIEVLTDRPAERFAVGRLVYREGSSDPLTVAGAEPVTSGQGWWLRLAEINDRSSAEGLRGVYLEADVAADDRPAGGAWWHEVIGARVIAADGRDLGRVVDVYRAGGAEVFVADGPAGRLDIPAVRAVVTEFQPLEGRLIVDPASLGLDEATAP